MHLRDMQRTLLVCVAFICTARGGEASGASCTANFGNCYESQCCSSTVNYGCYRKRGKAYAQCRRKGEGACVDEVGRAVAVVLCPLVDGALEEAGAFGPHGALDVLRVDDVVGSWVEAEP